jgi:hypothetical protein
VGNSFVRIHKQIFRRAGCQWTVRSSLEYRTYQAPCSAGDLPHLTLLLQVDGSGHTGEGFRFAVSSERISATIWSRDLYDIPELEGYRLDYEVRGEDIEIRPNSLASKWEDLETLIGRERILVSEPDGSDILNSRFREKLSSAKLDDDRLGASVRWAVQASPRGELKLVLQGLPATARALRAEPRLAADDTAAIHLDIFETDSNLQKSGPSRGPIPVLFARDPEAVHEALVLHPSRLLTGEKSFTNVG